MKDVVRTISAALAWLCLWAGLGVRAYAGEPKEDDILELVREIESVDRMVRQDALMALQRVGPAGAPAVPGLGRLLFDSPGAEPLRVELVRILESIGTPETEPLFRRALKDEDGRVVAWAALGLVRRHQVAERAVIEILVEETTWQVSVEDVLHALAGLRNATAEGLAPAVPLLRDAVRQRPMQPEGDLEADGFCAAARTLLNAGLYADEVREGLRRFLAREDAPNWESAWGDAALMLTRSDPESALPHLLRYLDTQGFTARTDNDVLERVAAMAPSFPSALEALLDMVRDEWMRQHMQVNDLVRVSKVLAGIGTADAVRVLPLALRDAPEAILPLLEALGEQARPALSSLAEVVAYMVDGEEAHWMYEKEGIVERTVALLATVGGAAAVPHLRELIQRGTLVPEARVPIVEALARIGTDAAREELLGMLEVGGVELVAPVLPSLGERARAFVPALAWVLLRGPNDVRWTEDDGVDEEGDDLAKRDWIRRARVAALRAVMALGPTAEQALPALAHVREVPGDLSRDDVVEAIRAVTSNGATRADLVDRMLGWLAAADPSLRLHSALALAWRREASERTVPILADGLAQLGNQDCTYVLQRLGHLGPAAGNAVPAILRLPSSRKDAPLGAVVDAVVGIGKGLDAVVDLLVLRLSEDADWGERLEAVVLLARLGPAAIEALPALRRLLDDADFEDLQAEAANGRPLLEDALERIVG